MDSLQVTPFVVHALLSSQEKICIIDVREPWEIEKVFLKNTLHIPLKDLPQRLGEIPLEGCIYTLCHHGVRSLKAAVFLQGTGCHALSIRGGIEAWAREIDPTIGVY